MKKLLASSAFCLLVATGAQASSINFGFTFDGTDLTNDAGFDTVAGTSVAVGDDVTVDFSAAGGDFFRVGAGFSNVFVPLSFITNGSATRQTTAVAEFFLDGALVNTITETSITQRYAHFGANIWSLAEGLEFDQVVLNATLESSDAATVLRGNDAIFFEPGFWGSQNVNYVESAQVPLPAAGVLLLAGLGAFGAVGRKRRKTA